jgi:Holliday junction resolvase RusA-like endonuclease
MFYFRAYGRPAPQGSKKFVGNGRFIEASKYLKPWRESLATAIWAAQETRETYARFEGPVVVEAVFLIAKPGSVKRLWPSVMPDLDKLQRGLGDSLETDTQLLASDSLIVKWVASKVYVAQHEGGVVCTIRDATEEDLKELNDTAKAGN